MLWVGPLLRWAIGKVFIVRVRSVVRFLRTGSIPFRLPGGFSFRVSATIESRRSRRKLRTASVSDPKTQNKSAHPTRFLRPRQVVGYQEIGSFCWGIVASGSDGLSVRLN